MTAVVTCHCGAEATLRENSLLYNGRSYGNGKAWICTRFPVCRGSVGTHPDGRPLGTIPDDETKKLRMKVHALVDPNWKREPINRIRKRKRNSVYGWLRRIMEMDKERCHVGMFTKADCLKALDLIPKNPFRSHAPECKRSQYFNGERGTACTCGVRPTLYENRG